VRATSARIFALGALAALVTAVGLACSTFASQTDEPVPAEASASEVGDRPLAEASLPDASAPEATADAGHDAQFSLTCGASTCTVPGDGCCFDREQGATTAFHCAKVGDVCDPNKAGIPRYACDDTDDCTALGKPGNICCGSLVANGNVYYLGAATCVLAENCAGRDEVRRCDRSVPGQCPSGKPCVDLDKYPDPSDGGVWAVSPTFPACQR
jgi:hypothetical protein